MSPQEERILDNIKVTFNKYSIPFIWATSLVSLARKEGRIYDDYAVAVLNDVRVTFLTNSVFGYLNCFIQMT